MTRITETKSVKVDNWGVFFLQKLQNFFNKTDHCDLTLQFNDNSQLKVHRLVLSACTDYFNMLENTCEVYDDVLIMPLDLQADVIVPIVNFMYTGTLEFQYNMYEKLLKTARDMNMTVLLKLLEAHKQTTRMVQGTRQPVVLNKQAPTRPRPEAQSNVSFQMQPASRNYGMAKQSARTIAPRGPQISKQISTSASGYSANTTMSVSEPHTLVSKYATVKDNKPGPSRFDENSLSEAFEGSFDNISYESKPLVTADQIKKEDDTSPFEKLRKGYTNVNVVKRPAPSISAAPLAKKPNLDEVKEFTEAARLRSQMVNEDDDSPGMADDTRFDDEEEEEEQQQTPIKQSPKSYGFSPSATKQVVVKQEPKSTPHVGAVKQITVKDESGSVDHAKIISEVLKKYPHLVKKNKNIKLKIMQKTNPTNISTQGQAQTPAAPVKMEVRTATPLKTDISMVRKATEGIRQGPIASSTPAPKKIDSKTMHALIAKGAENMTGPWLCLRCGIDGRPISIPSYKAFRNHLIVKHKERIDARICEHCGWKAEVRNPNLFYHWLTEHNIKSSIKFPRCDECGHVAMNLSKLQKHEEENHQKVDLQQCIYCNKVFAKEMDLYEHMKSLHKQKAREDGVIDFSEDEYQVDEAEEHCVNSSQENKIKILSNISFTNNAAIPFVIDTSQAQTVSQIGGKSQLHLQQITLEPSSEAEALSNVASGIATSLGLVDNASVVIGESTFQGQFIEHQLATVHGETATTTTVTSAVAPDQLTKLITEDGTELQLTQSQKDEIFSQLQNSENGGNVVMVLNDGNFISGGGLQLEDGTQIINTTGTTVQDSNIVVMYSQAGEELITHSSTALAKDAGPISSSEQQQQQVVSMEADQQPASVTPVHEDETSQASTQPSEKTCERETEDGSHQMEVDEGDSQEVPEEERTEEETKEEDHSADLSGSSEVLQQIVQQDEEEDSKQGDDSEKAVKEREKLKLISELEGDWSEDTEDHPSVLVEKPEAKSVEPASDPPSGVAPTSEESKFSEEKKEPQRDKDEGKLNESEISELLDDWNNETKFTESDSDADLEKKLEKVVGEKKEESTNIESKEDDAVEASTADNTVDSVDDGANDTQVVIMPAESETDISVKEEEADKEHDEKSTTPKVKEQDDVEEAEKADEKDASKDEETKAKSKEVVSSLLGDWDEDEDDDL
ncbi:centrosome-associated zinc finger protein CP190 [Toxorhynchites rutilus septentrionalis]|uniref:centrosome-associated zinc finger protein CP190 n=1 Tax=Toxorhynchites rutilus septentrionalis TaxID=329112 RepID=UPI0024784FF7|nr:centrosome-associated zinc finger protein CP190 [Toxorhynchites rutilus septentrionalis]XP_055638660.1 centrosome-associated zinc finger protein CP190 [Toxorhynchites rutilus septentrionalis]